MRACSDGGTPPRKTSASVPRLMPENARLDQHLAGPGAGASARSSATPGADDPERARHQAPSGIGSGASGLMRSITIWLCTRATAGCGSSTSCTSRFSAGEVAAVDPQQVVGLAGQRPGAGDLRACAG